MNKLLIVFFFLLTVLSCKKNRDETFPFVEFLSPGFQSQFQVLNPIPFKIKANDNQNIEQITVYLLNQSLQSVAPSVTVRPGGTSYTYEYYITPTDIHLPTGTYFLKAVVSDGYQEKVEYREIHLNEVPLQLKQVWVARKISPQHYFLDTISGTGLQSVYDIQNDFSGLICNSYFGRIFAAGGKTGDAQMFRSGYPQPYFSIANTGSGNENFFSGLHFQTDRIYVATRDGLIRSFSNSPNSQDVFNASGVFSEAMAVAGSYLVSASVQSAGMQRSIQVYHRGSAAFFQSTVSDIEAKKMFALSNDEILLFGNSGGNGEIRFYSISSNQLTEPFSFTGGEIHDVSDIDGTNFLIAHSNGISVYQHNNSLQNDLITGTTFRYINYEPLSNTFFAAGYTELRRFDISGTSILEYYNVGDTIADLELLYNK